MHELSIEANLDNVAAVLDFVESHLSGCSAKTISRIGVAVDEVFSNIARYAYRTASGSEPDAGNATVRITVEDDVTIEFEDSGAPYNPLAKDDPDVTIPADEREIGGLGIFIVKNIMDTVEYRREGGKNILTIKKEIG